MQRFSFGRIVAVGAFLAAAAPAAQAQAPVPQCTQLGGAFTAEQIVAACTAVIQSGKVQGPALAALLTFRGYAQEEMDQPELAIADFSAAIELEPTAARFDARCSTRSLEDQLEAALADCNEALKRTPQSADVLDSRGFVYMKMGRYDEAIIDLNAALALKPGFTNAMFTRGIAKLRKGDSISGLADIAAAKAIELGVGDRFQFYGVSEK